MVSIVTASPPMASWAIQGPATGIFSISETPMRVAKNDSSSQGSRYPEKPKNIAMPSRARPVSQVNSRGRR